LKIPVIFEGWFWYCLKTGKLEPTTGFEVTLNAMDIDESASSNNNGESVQSTDVVELQQQLAEANRKIRRLENAASNRGGGSQQGPFLTGYKIINY